LTIKHFNEDWPLFEALINDRAYLYQVLLGGAAKARTMDSSTWPAPVKRQGLIELIL
jgi:hypothetical protein